MARYLTGYALVLSVNGLAHKIEHFGRVNEVKCKVEVTERYIGKDND